MSVCHVGIIIMAQLNNFQARRKTLLSKFRTILIVVYIISLVTTVIGVAINTRYEVYNTANKELSLLVDMVKSVRTFIAEDMRPVLLEKNIFHSPGVSSTVATKHIASRFLKAQPDYYIKIASDNPLNPANKPEPLEQKILKTFRADRNLKELKEQGIISGKNFLVSSRPSISKDSCLRCHGLYADAPLTIQQEYSPNSGFNYVSDQVVGASVVGVPINNVNSIIFKRVGIAFLVLTFIFSVIFLLIDFLVKYFIIKPVQNLSTMAIKMSEGSLEEEIIAERRDEIGALANAIELMRRSLVSATNRLKKKHDN